MRFPFRLWHMMVGIDLLGIELDDVLIGDHACEQEASSLWVTIDAVERVSGTMLSDAQRRAEIKAQERDEYEYAHAHPKMPRRRRRR